MIMQQDHWYLKRNIIYSNKMFLMFFLKQSHYQLIIVLIQIPVLKRIEQWLDDRNVRKNVQLQENADLRTCSEHVDIMLSIIAASRKVNFFLIIFLPPESSSFSKLMAIVIVPRWSLLMWSVRLCTISTWWETDSYYALPYRTQSFNDSFGETNESRAILKALNL